MVTFTKGQIPKGYRNVNLPTECYMLFPTVFCIVGILYLLILNSHVSILLTVYVLNKIVKDFKEYYQSSVNKCNAPLQFYRLTTSHQKAGWCFAHINRTWGAFYNTTLVYYRLECVLVFYQLYWGYYNKSVLYSLPFCLTTSLNNVITFAFQFMP